MNRQDRTRSSVHHTNVCSLGWVSSASDATFVGMNDFDSIIAASFDEVDSARALGTEDLCARLGRTIRKARSMSVGTTEVLESADGFCVLAYLDPADHESGQVTILVETRVDTPNGKHTCTGWVKVSKTALADEAALEAAVTEACSNMEARKADVLAGPTIT